MKKSFIIIVLFPLFVACSNNGNKSDSKNSLKKEVMDTAIRYASEKFKEAKVTVAKDGVVTIVEKQPNLITSPAYQLRYIIDPLKIAIGLIDDDTNEDAIINITSVTGQDTETPENLILINTDGKFVLNRVIESNMKVLGIKDRVITAEVSSRSLNTPLRDCHECKEVIKYKFKAGDLIRLE